MVAWKTPLRSLALLVVLAAPAALIGARNGPQLAQGARLIDVDAHIAEAGGFSPDSITVRTGQRSRLRFHAADVAHGVAIGPGLGLDLGDIASGATASVDLTFDHAGSYTFYCNKWCSPEHWRMRGVIQVVDDRLPPPTPVSDPVIDNLVAEGVDIDAYLAHEDHATPVQPTPALTPATPPMSAEGGAGAVQAAALVIPPELQDAQWRRTHAPADAAALLMAANPSAAADQIAGAMPSLWASNRSPDQLGNAATFFAKNCAACHGEQGNGDGFAAGSVTGSVTGSGTTPPPSLADPQRMASRRSDVLYAKIRRGGMGTGMPNFGTLLTPQETWDLVEYIWYLAYARQP